DLPSRRIRGASISGSPRLDRTRAALDENARLDVVDPVLAAVGLDLGRLRSGLREDDRDAERLGALRDLDPDPRVDDEVDPLDGRGDVLEPLPAGLPVDRVEPRVHGQGLVAPLAEVVEDLPPPLLAAIARADDGDALLAEKFVDDLV